MCPSISVIIVTYNSGPVIRPTLDAVFKQDHPDYEAILVDNASRDDSLAVAREYEAAGLRVVANADNRGFAGGNNQAARMARGDILFLVNPDAVMPPDCLRRLAAVFESEQQIGVLGAKLMAPDGVTVLHCGGDIGMPMHGHLRGYGEKDGPQWSTPADVDFVVGAAMAVPRNVWDLLGGFDEDFYPAYFEDVDLCIRCRRMGYRVMFHPDVVLTHHEHRSGDYQSPQFWHMHHRNRLWLMAKDLPAGALLLRAVPAELVWLLSSHSRGLRRMMMRLYWQIFKRTVRRRLLRLPPRNA